MTADPVDAIMQVMEQAFEPAFGEAWTRRQVADALLLPHTHWLLAGADGTIGLSVAQPHGFTLSRQAADEEELLLIGVITSSQRRGIGQRLLEALFQSARARGSRRMFLEMREGNPALGLYLRLGFEPIGRRRGYYRGAADGPLDAITFARSL